jgi:signal transduction histidine kinase
MVAPWPGMLRLEWSNDFKIQSVEGDASTLTGRGGNTLVGVAVWEALKVPREQVQALARTSPSYLSRLEGNRHHYIRAVVERDGLGFFLDMDCALEGAPPIQISRLSSSLSHEIRNPLSSVKMAVQTLARNLELSDRDKRRLTIANREIRTMERMLWVLSEYGRDTPADVQEHALRAIVVDAAAMVESELKERNVELDIGEQPESIKVRVDAQRLRPVLSQLLINVAMGLETGGQLKVTLKASGGKAQVEIIDAAAALPPEEAGTLFEPFGSRLARGAGMSLAALNRVVRAIGGEVTATGSEKPGTVLTVTLPSP